MKARFIFSPFFTPIICTVFIINAVKADDLYWDSDADATVAIGGSGVWNTSGALWRLANETGGLQVYNNISPSAVTARLAGTAGTLSIAAGTTINVNKVSVGTTGYTVAGADPSSILNLSGTAPEIAGSGTTSFTSKITGAAGFTLSSGSFNIIAGDLSGLSGMVNVNARATLQGIAYGVGNGAAVLTGSQFQEWNVANVLTSNNHGTGTTIQIGALSGASTGVVRSGNDGTGVGPAGNDIFQVGALNTNTTFAGSLQNFGTTGFTGLSKVGTGTLTLSGTNLIHTGATTVTAGALIITGTSGTGSIGSLNLTGSSSTINFASTGTLKATTLIEGSAASDAGIFNHTTGTLTLSGDMALGSFGGYGAYNMSGGTLTVPNLRGGSANGAGSDGSSYIYQTGGTITVAGVTSLNRNGIGTNVLNIAGAGAVFNQGSGSNLNLGYALGGTGVCTVSAGLLSVANSITFGNNNANGILNLNGGTAMVNSITQIGDNSVGMGTVNLNGGLLQAKADNASFMGGISHANICAGGAKFDTNGKNITVAQSLLTTADTTGVSAIPVATGGSGYLSAPVVSITGDGAGASAVANVTGGVVTSITITSAGTGYTAPPSVTLTGGGASAVATLGTIVIGANTPDGGLTKTGAGILTLKGDNTYSGPTVISAGTLQAGGFSSVFGLNSTVTLADAAEVALDLNNNSTQVGFLTGGGPSGGNVTLGMGILTVGGTNPSPITYAGAISGEGGGLVKTGTNTQILSGINSYTGDTYIEDGTLKLASTGRLNFTIADDFNNMISGFGSLVIDGSFDINTSAVTADSGSWVLVDRSGFTSSTFGSTFSPGVGWVKTSNVWKLNSGARTWTFTEANGTLSLSTSSGTYAAWINGFFSGQTNAALVGANADPDNDGVTNAVEMVSGGNPATGMDTALAPSCELVVNPAGISAGSYFLFTFRRTDLSVASGVTSVCQYNTSLSGTWNTAVDNVGGVKILVDDNYALFSPPATSTDRVRVFIPRGANTTLFGRLNAKVP